jgi:hypothetical protein
MDKNVEFAKAFPNIRLPEGRLFLILAVALAAIVEISHEPGHLMHPELFAEDGPFWLANAYNNGLQSLLQPLAGYLQTVSRLVALFAVLFPMTSVPRTFAVAALCIELLPIILILSDRARLLIPSQSARIMLAVFYICAPNSFEVFINLTNAMWSLALTAFMVIILPKPKAIGAKIFDYTVLVMSGLSGPIVIFNAIIAWWTVIGDDKKNLRENLLYAVLTSVCALVQLSVIFSDPSSRPYNLGATPNRFIHIVLDQVIFGGTIGNHIVARLMTNSWWMNFFPAILFFCLAMLLGLTAFIKGPPAHRKFVFLSAAIFLAALKSPEVSRSAPQWFVMQTPGAGDRYYVIPILCWFTSLLVLSARPWYSIPERIGHWIARIIIISCCIGSFYDWHYDPLAKNDFHWVAKQFDHAPIGKVFMIPVSPPSFNFLLMKQRPSI